MHVDRRSRPLTLALAVSLLLVFAACDDSPTRPRDVPTAGFTIQAAASDGTSVTSSSPFPLTVGPPPVNARVASVATFPDRDQPINLRYRITPPGFETEEQDFEYLFRNPGEYLTEQQAEVRGEVDTAQMVVFITRSEASAAAVRAATESGALRGRGGDWAVRARDLERQVRAFVPIAQSHADLGRYDVQSAVVFIENPAIAETLEEIRTGRR